MASTHVRVACRALHTAAGALGVADEGRYNCSCKLLDLACRHGPVQDEISCDRDVNVEGESGSSNVAVGVYLGRWFSASVSRTLDCGSSYLLVIFLLLFDSQPLPIRRIMDNEIAFPGSGLLHAHLSKYRQIGTFHLIRRSNC